MIRDNNWRAGCNGGGARPWFVFRYVDGKQEVLSDSRGLYRRFKSYEAAQRAAEAAQ